jgi:hypothetical protein
MRNTCNNWRKKMKKEIMHEMERLLKFEMIAMDSVANDNLNETELKFIIEKIFEASNMILRLRNVLKELEGK